MRKLIITFCLMLLCMIISGSRVYAVFIYDITEFVQFDGTDTFTDTFGDDIEPPIGPDGVTINYFLDPSVPTFPDGRESGGLLELNSADGWIDEDERLIGAMVNNSTYFFSDGSGGHLIGAFEVNDGFSPNTFFSIGIVTGPIEDEAWAEIHIDPSGNILALWGNESTANTQDITMALGTNTKITMKLEIDFSNSVTAMWDYGSNNTFDLIKTNFTTLDFLSGQGYTGVFEASEPIVNIVPEPATVALLGIGLAGLAGAAVRRRLKKTKRQ